MCKHYRKVSRGQVWFLVDPDLPAVHYRDSVQGKNRPWLVVSNDVCNQTSPIYTVVPFTTAVKNNMPVHVSFQDGDKTQTILCEQIRTVPERLFFNSGSYYKYTLSDDLMRQVDEALSVQLSLSLLMPNSERFWKSVEQMIRLKVKEAIKCAKVDNIDIGKIATMLTVSVDDELDKIASKEIIVPENPPEAHMTEKFKMIQSTETIPKSKSSKNIWTTESKKDFCDTYYKYGAQAAADKYNIKLGSAYRLKWSFEKELKDGTT